MIFFRYSTSVAASYSGHSLDHFFHVGLGHSRIDRQRDDLFERRARIRKMFRLIAKLITIIRMQMKRNKMHRSADLVFSQQFDELVAIDLEPSQIQLNYKKMP